MTGSLLPWLIAAAGLGSMAWGLWQWWAVPRPLSFQPAAPALRRTAGLNASWISLTGWAITPRQLRQANRIAAALVGVLVTLITRNPLIGSALALLAAGWPEGVVRNAARRQWTQLDKMALSACTSVQFAVEDRRPVLPVFERLYAQSDGVLHRFLEPCLSAEGAGVAAFEARLKEAARAIRHIELQLVADVLAAERHRGNTAALIATVLHLWSQRLEADARRRGQIRAGSLLAKALVSGSLIVLAVLWLASPAVSHGARHGLGLVIIGLGTWLIALGAWLARQAERQAEQV